MLQQADNSRVFRYIAIYKYKSCMCAKLEKGKLTYNIIKYNRYYYTTKILKANTQPLKKKIG